MWRNRSVTKNLTYLGNNSEYAQIESSTIDYAFVEKIENIKVVLGEFEWSDLGTLKNLFESMKKDKNNNYLSKNSYISGEVKNCNIIHDKKIALIIGLENIVLVCDKEHLLVSSIEKTGELKTIINSLKIKDVEL
jgi:mannose-1-phosphate guanylyltransferase